MLTYNELHINVCQVTLCYDRIITKTFSETPWEQHSLGNINRDIKCCKWILCLILLITSDGCIRRTLKSTKVGKFRVSLNVVNLSMQASISTDLPCSSVDNALGRHVQWSVTYCVGFKARSGPIWSFIRSFRGQGSSLLWTPALRPYVGPMR